MEEVSEEEDDLSDDDDQARKKNPKNDMIYEVFTT